MRQIATLLYNPSNGMPYMTDAEQPTAETFREQQGAVAWLYNPWTRAKRDPRDIGSDVYGHLIVPPNEEGELEAPDWRFRALHVDSQWRVRWYGSNPDRGYSIWSEKGDLVVKLGPDISSEAVHEIVNMHNAALTVLLIRNRNLANELSVVRT